MDKPRVYAGIVTYNPDLERLKQNIEAVLPQVELVYVFDNGSKNILGIEKLIEPYSEGSILIHKNGTNAGIAAALNAICSWGYEHQFDYALTFDQDSIAPNQLVEMLSECVDEKVGIVCPAIHDINRTGFQQKNTVEEIRQCITSGAMTSVKAWEDIGGFDESMFIDGVDFDFCLRLRKNGWKILQNNNAVLTHEIGHIEEHRFLFWKVAVKNHSAFRKYYIARNLVYLDRKHKPKGYPVKTIMRLVKQILLILLYEENKAEKIRRFFSGMCSGMSARMG